MHIWLYSKSMHVASYGIKFTTSGWAPRPSSIAITAAPRRRHSHFICAIITRSCCYSLKNRTEQIEVVTSGLQGTR